jgi:phosphoserine phosphatase
MVSPATALRADDSYLKLGLQGEVCSDAFHEITASARLFAEAPALTADMAGQTSIVLVRHGEVPGISPPRFRGRSELPLTEVGLSQAALTRDHLAARIVPAAIYASPLSRCMDTARIIGQPHSLDPVPLALFADVDYGTWQGRSYAEVEQAEPTAFAQWRRMPQLAAIPGGEALPEVAARVSSTMRLILERHRGATVFLIGHDSVNRVFLLTALDLPLSRYWHLRQDPCGISLLDHDPGEAWTVRSINETGHLVIRRDGQ